MDAKSDKDIWKHWTTEIPWPRAAFCLCYYCGDEKDTADCRFAPSGRRAICSRCQKTIYFSK